MKYQYYFFHGILYYLIFFSSQLYSKNLNFNITDSTKTSAFENSVEDANSDSIEIDKLRIIYHNLEYDSKSFEDVKERWIINDINFIRVIYNQFLANDALRVNDKRPSNEYLDYFKKLISEEKVYGIVTKRYFDDEIGKFQFKIKPNFKNSLAELKEKIPFASSVLPDPTIDPFYLKEIVGEEVYNKMKIKDFFIDITKKQFSLEKPTNFDIKFSLFNPELMFWQSTTQEVDKYFISAFGKWGNDKIIIPGWFASDYIGGIKLTYAKNINKPNDSSYSIALGTSFIGGHLFPKDLPSSPIFFSGRSLYLKLQGNPLSLINSNLKMVKKFSIFIEGKFRLEEYDRKKYAFKNEKEFYSVKDYFILGMNYNNITKIDLFNLFELGDLNTSIGYALADIVHLKSFPHKTEITSLDSTSNIWKRAQHHFFVNIGFFNDEDFFQRNISLLLSYNLKYKYSYLGIKFFAMLGETVGIDLRFFSKLNSSDIKTPSWRNDTYFLFSPIIRLNY